MMDNYKNLVAAVLFSITLLVGGCVKQKTASETSSVQQVATLKDLLNTKPFEMPDGSKFHFGIETAHAKEDGYFSAYCLLTNASSPELLFPNGVDNVEYNLGPLSIIPKEQIDDVGNGDKIAYARRDQIKLPVLYACSIPISKDRTRTYNVIFGKETVFSFHIPATTTKCVPGYQLIEVNNVYRIQQQAIPRRSFILHSINLKNNFLLGRFDFSKNSFKVAIYKNQVELLFKSPVYDDTSFYLIKLWINGRPLLVSFEPVRLRIGESENCQAVAAERIAQQNAIQFNIDWHSCLNGHIKNGDKITVQFIYAPFLTEGVFANTRTVPNLPSLENDIKIMYSNKANFIYNESDYQQTKEGQQ